MKSIKQHFNQICFKKYKALGFSKNKMTFAKVSGDVLQVFTFKCIENNTKCSVEFGVFPMCMPKPVFLEHGGYFLDGFLVEQQYSGWRFNPLSDESKIECIRLISRTIDLYLLPFLDLCNNCKSSLRELIRLDELFDYNRCQKLVLNGGTDYATPWQERSLFDRRKYFMALKAHDFSYAQRYLEHQIDFCKSNLESLNSQDSPKQPEIVKKRFQENLALHVEHMEKLETEGFGYFETLLQTNEKEMIQFLATQFNLDM